MIYACHKNESKILGLFELLKAIYFIVGRIFWYNSEMEVLNVDIVMEFKCFNNILEPAFIIGLESDLLH